MLGPNAGGDLQETAPAIQRKDSAAGGEHSAEFEAQELVDIGGKNPVGLQPLGLAEFRQTVAGKNHWNPAPLLDLLHFAPHALSIEAIPRLIGDLGARNEASTSDSPRRIQNPDSRFRSEQSKHTLPDRRAGLCVGEKEGAPRERKAPESKSEIVFNDSINKDPPS